jgi:ribosome biogenesis GTPase
VQDRIIARVSLSRGERAQVFMDGLEYEALVAGALQHGDGPIPVTGDWVAVRRVDEGLVLIEEVLPRRSKIARRAAGRRAEEQVLAANVDVALIVCGLDGDFNVRRIERYLAICIDGGVKPVVVLNKADLCPDPESALAEARAVTRSAPLALVSAQTGKGCDGLIEAGITAVLLGSSGAGKSTLLNRLAGGDLHLTAPVRESDSRGRHTTTDRELILLPSGAALIDTPGLREIQLLASENSIAAVFDEIAALSEHCRFRDCTHREEPGCAVREGVSPDRLHSYHKLLRESTRATDELARKKEWRRIHRSLRTLYKLRGKT